MLLSLTDSPETCCSWIDAISPILGASSTQKLAVGVMEKELDAMSPALGASSAQQPAAVVLEGELDAMSPDLGASSTQSPFGFGTLVVVSEDVGASSALLLVDWGNLSLSPPSLVHVCNPTSVILTVGTQTSTSRTLFQAPTRQAFGRQRSPHWYFLGSRTTCTPPGRDETVRRRGAKSRRPSVRRGRRSASALQILHDRETSTDGQFAGSIQCGTFHAGGTLRLLKSQCDGSEE